MTAEQIWDQMSPREKLMLCVEQVEWAIFRATIDGLTIAPESLRSVIVAKRVVTNNKKTDDLATEMHLANDACNTEEEGLERSNKEAKELGRWLLAHMCWAVAWDAYSKLGNEESDLDLALDSMCYSYIETLGDEWRQSPIGVWMREHGIELLERDASKVMW